MAALTDSSDYESTGSEDGDDVDGDEGQGEVQERKTILAKVAVLVARARDSSVRFPRSRKPNAHRDRPWAIEFIRSWSDDMFHRQFRLSSVSTFMMSSVGFYQRSK